MTNVRSFTFDSSQHFDDLNDVKYKYVNPQRKKKRTANMTIFTS